MREPQQQRSAGSTRRMLTAAGELVAEHGLDGATVAAVARRSGTSNGALYHRFGDRAGVLHATLEQALADLVASTQAAFDEAGAEPDDDRAIRLLSGAAVRLFADYRLLLRPFLAAPEFRDAFARTSHALAGTVTGWLQQRFDATEADAEAAYRVLLALGTQQALFDDAETSPRPLAQEQLVDAVARATSALVRR